MYCLIKISKYVINKYYSVPKSKFNTKKYLDKLNDSFFSKHMLYLYQLKIICLPAVEIMKPKILNCIQKQKFVLTGQS